MAKSHPNHNATRTVSAQPRLHQRARENSSLQFSEPHVAAGTRGTCAP